MTMSMFYAEWHTDPELPRTDWSRLEPVPEAERIDAKAHSDAIWAHCEKVRREITQAKYRMRFPRARWGDAA